MGNYTTTNSQKQDSAPIAGVTENVPAADYHRSFGMTKSGLMMLHKSPAHFYHWLTSEPEPSTKAMSLGTVTHTLLFEPHKFDSETAIIPADAPSKPTKAMLDAKKPSEETVAKIAWWAKFNEEVGDKTTISEAELEQAKSMVAAVRSHEDAIPLLDHPSAKAEVSISAVENVLGLEIPCKMRCDLLTEDGKTIVDLKTCEDASQNGFQRTFLSYGYWMQAAHYIATARLAGIPVERFVFIAAEKNPPYCVGLYSVKAEEFEKGFAIRKRLLEVYASCVATGKFPAYAKGFSNLTLPSWLS